MVRRSIYSQLSALVNQYFELNSRSFLDDLITYHLNIDPMEISKSGLKEIQSWLEITVDMMIADKQSVTKLIAQLRTLTESS